MPFPRFDVASLDTWTTLNHQYGQASIGFTGGGEIIGKVTIRDPLLRSVDNPVLCDTSSEHGLSPKDNVHTPVLRLDCGCLQSSHITTSKGLKPVSGGVKMASWLTHLPLRRGK
jgi:hypothetical protein